MHTKKPVGQLLIDLGTWLHSVSLLAALNTHPLDVTQHTPARVITQLGDVYLATASFRKQVDDGKQSLFIVSRGHAAVQVASMLRQIVADIARLQAAHAATEGQLIAKLAALKVLQADANDVDELVKLGQECVQLRRVKEAQESEGLRLIARRDGLQQEAAAGGAPATAASVMALPGLGAAHVPALLQAESLIVPTRALLARFTDEDGDVDVAMVSARAKFWVDSFVEAPVVSAAENLAELLQRSSDFYHLRRLNQWDSVPWACSCQFYYMNYRCSHSIAFSVAEGAWTTPERFRDVKLLRKRRRGRHRKAHGRYERDEPPEIDEQDEA